MRTHPSDTVRQGGCTGVPAPQGRNAPRRCSPAASHAAESYGDDSAVFPARPADIPGRPRGRRRRTSAAGASLRRRL